MNLGENLNADAQELITGRTCILAQSGGGKSYGMGVICEELCRQGLGFAVIDTEGEYSSLKQKFDVVWVGNSKECDITLDKINFDDFSRKAMMSNMAVIFDVSDAMDLMSVVDKICSSLYRTASELKLPYLLIIEEADKFAPQRNGKVVGSLNEIARRGRKRGLGLLIASQRPAFVNKDVLSQCNNQFIGKLTIQNDLNAVRQFFNVREELLKLPDLNYEFFAMGSIVNGKDTLFKFKKRETKHGGLTPSIKAKKTKNLNEFLKEIKEHQIFEQISITPKISYETARKKAEKMLKKKFVLFGDNTEKISSVSIELTPVIEADIEVKRKNMLGKQVLKKYRVLFDAKSGSMMDYNFKHHLGTYELMEFDYTMYSLLKLLKKGDMSIDEINSRVNKNAEIAVKKLRDKKYISTRTEKRRNIYSLHYDEKFYRISDFEVKKNYQVKKIEVQEIVRPVYNTGDLNKIISCLEENFVIKNERMIYYPLYNISIKGETHRLVRINGVTGKIINT
ncbi:MAG: DUF87 domain-containing protein [Candidatus Nanoarchaeia archaeon]|nr:DUF87 domain-containing protein [Candidatus Nanoarchaeia archaeon]